MSAGVAIVLVEYHSGGLVAERACEAVVAGFEVVVADNSGSYTGPGVVVRTGGNVGFGSACNAAVAALDQTIDVLVFQNPDALAPPGAADALADLVHDGPWVALAPSIAGDRLRPDGFAVPDRLREVLLVCKDCVRARRRPAAECVPASTLRSPLGAPTPTMRPGRFASAAFLAVDRRAFDAVGGFDPRFFLYVEDLDLWQRIAAQGPVGFVPEIVAWHGEEGGSRGSRVRRTLLRWLGRETLAEISGRRWLHLRVLHRVGQAFLPSTSGDVLAEMIRTAMWTRDSPSDVQQQVRQAALGSDRGGPDEPTAPQKRRPA